MFVGMIKLSIQLNFVMTIFETEKDVTLTVKLMLQDGNAQ